MGWDREVSRTDVTDTGREKECTNESFVSDVVLRALN